MEPFAVYFCTDSFSAGKTNDDHLPILLEKTTGPNHYLHIDQQNYILKNELTARKSMGYLCQMNRKKPFVQIEETIKG